MKSDNQIKVIFVGGGSGGHLSIIQAMVSFLKQENFPVDSNLLVVGGKLGMIQDPGLSLDERRIPEMGVPYQFIRGGKLHRGLNAGFSFGQLMTTLRLLWGFWGGIIDSFKIIKSFKPNVIFSSGGYVSLPIVIVGKLFGVKVVIHEQTLRAGIANRISGLFANKILLTFEDSKSLFPRKKSIVIGNLLRKEVSEIISNVPEKLKNLVELSRLNKRKIVYITGGSLGAHKINVFFEKNLSNILQNYSLVWQMGENELYNDFERIAKESDSPYIYMTKFVKEELGYILSVADVVVTRPGANTLFELASLNKKALIIPLWVTSKSDQLLNAKWFEKNFNGVVLSEKELTLDLFTLSLGKLISQQPSSGNPMHIATPEQIWNEILEF